MPSTLSADVSFLNDMLTKGGCWVLRRRLQSVTWIVPSASEGFWHVAHLDIGSGTVRASIKPSTPQGIEWFLDLELDGIDYTVLPWVQSFEHKPCRKNPFEKRSPT